MDLQAKYSGPTSAWRKRLIQEVSRKHSRRAA